jgi:Uma2 family endonuclease
MVALQNQPPSTVLEYPGPITYSDWLELDEDAGRRIELWNGELVELTIPDGVHQEISLAFTLAFAPFVKSIPGAKLFYEFGVRFSNTTVVEPDILIVTGKAGGKYTRRAIEGPPDLILEIISPNGRKRDLVQKSALYAAEGVPEYWIVDVDRRIVLVGNLREGDYERTIVSDGSIACQALGGAMIDISFLATIGADLAEASDASSDQA